MDLLTVHGHRRPDRCQRICNLLHYLLGGEVGAVQVNGKVAQPCKIQAMLYNLKCSLLFSHKQNAFSICRKAGNKVGDSLALSSSWRTVDHAALICGDGGDRSLLT